MPHNEIRRTEKSLTRFPPDMDDVEVIVRFVDELGKLDADCLAFVAYMPTVIPDEPNSAALLLGTVNAAYEMQKIYPDQFPKDLKAPSNKNKNKSKDNEES